MKAFNSGDSLRSAFLALDAITDHFLAGIKKDDGNQMLSLAIGGMLGKISSSVSKNPSFNQNEEWFDTMMAILQLYAMNKYCDDISLDSLFKGEAAAVDRRAH